MISRILNICGVYLGEERDLVGPTEGNKKGHWENKHVLSINEGILRFFDGSWNVVPDFPANWEQDRGLNKLYEEASDFVSGMDRKASLRGFKEPRTCLTLPFWQKLVPEMVYLIPFRNPIEVAGSIKKRDAFKISEGFFLWLKYWEKILEGTYDKKRYFTPCKNYFVSREKELSRIKEFIDHENFTYEGRDTEIRNFISPHLLHVGFSDKRFMEINQQGKDILLSREITRNLFSELIETYKNIEKERDAALRMVNERNVQIELAHKELQEKNEMIQQKDLELNLIKSSKFWKLRNTYIYCKNRIRSLLLNPSNSC